MFMRLAHDLRFLALLITLMFLAVHPAGRNPLRPPLVELRGEAAATGRDAGADWRRGNRVAAALKKGLGPLLPATTHTRRRTPHRQPTPPVRICQAHGGPAGATSLPPAFAFTLPRVSRVARGFRTGLAVTTRNRCRGKWSARPPALAGRYGNARRIPLESVAGSDPEECQWSWRRLARTTRQRPSSVSP